MRRDHFGARAADGKVEIFVQDTGIGVGLALSRMILEAHGSDLELVSAQDKGSRFSFKLPPFSGGVSDLRAKAFS